MEMQRGKGKEGRFGTGEEPRNEEQNDDENGFDGDVFHLFNNYQIVNYKDSIFVMIHLFDYGRVFGYERAGKAT
jgi:hypothetical protein